MGVCLGIGKLEIQFGGKEEGKNVPAAVKDFTLVFGPVCVCSRGIDHTQQRGNFCTASHTPRWKLLHAVPPIHVRHTSTIPQLRYTCFFYTNFSIDFVECSQGRPHSARHLLILFFSTSQAVLLPPTGSPRRRMRWTTASRPAIWKSLYYLRSSPKRPHVFLEPRHLVSFQLTKRSAGPNKSKSVRYPFASWDDDGRSRELPTSGSGLQV